MNNKVRIILMAWGLLILIVGIGINSVVTFLCGLGFILMVSIDSMGG